MANIEFSPENGFSLIEEKINYLTNDVGEMLKKGQISEEAAKWLLSQFKNVVNICEDNKQFSEEQEKSRSVTF